jgi:hypothetical protein
MDNKTRYFLDMEALYRKQADNEPVRRERHIADAAAWRLLADARSFVVAKQIEIRDALALFDRPKNGGNVVR